MGSISARTVCPFPLKTLTSGTRRSDAADGTLVGIRRPLAEHEQPIMRTYLEVEDIQQAVDRAEHSGAIIAYPPTVQGRRGTFAIVIQGEVQHGLWQR